MFYNDIKMDNEHQRLKDFIESEIDRKSVALVPVVQLVECFEIDETDIEEARKEITEICHRISDDLQLQASYQFSSEFVEFRRIYDS